MTVTSQALHNGAVINAECLKCWQQFADPSGQAPCPNCGETARIRALATGKAPAQKAPMKTTSAAPSETRAAHLVAMILWGMAWGLNGVSTILPIALLGRSVDALGIFIGIGVTVHGIVTLIENHLWRSFAKCSNGEKALIGLEIFAVGLVDVGSAALVFFGFFLWLGIASYSLPWYAITTLIAGIVAIGSEPMIRFHRKLLRR
jgi:hypothetical protein